jgi:hypothetical protein
VALAVYFLFLQPTPAATATALAAAVLLPPTLPGAP